MRRPFQDTLHLRETLTSGSSLFFDALGAAVGCGSKRSTLSGRKTYRLNSFRRSAMMGSNRRSDWRFAPLRPEATASSSKPALRGIVFDVDGTLCAPQNYMFGEMREALGIPKSIDILDHLNGLPPGKQEIEFDKVKEIERRAMRQQTPQPGLTDLMQYLACRKVRRAICTRNFDEPVNHLLTNFIADHEFAPIVTRSFSPPKPDPAGILHIAHNWGIDGGERADHMIMVGDSIDDMKAGAGAGCVTILLESDANQHIRQHECTDVVITRLVIDLCSFDSTDLCPRLDALISILEEGRLPSD